jgi:hypothetical protein
MRLPCGCVLHPIASSLQTQSKKLPAAEWYVCAVMLVKPSSMTRARVSIFSFVLTGADSGSGAEFGADRAESGADCGADRPESGADCGTFRKRSRV